MVRKYKVLSGALFCFPLYWINPLFRQRQFVSTCTNFHFRCGVIDYIRIKTNYTALFSRYYGKLSFAFY